MTHSQFALVGCKEGKVSCDRTVEEFKQCSWSIELLQEVHHEDKLMPTVLSPSHGRVLYNIDNARTQSKGLGEVNMLLQLTHHYNSVNKVDSIKIPLNVHI